MSKNNYTEDLKKKMDDYAHEVYSVTRTFPKEELYGLTSQLRRAALSVVLNYIEGYARQKANVKYNFWEISYGSLKESKYLLHFSMIEGYLSKEDYKEVLKKADEIGAMLWKSLKSIKR
ncbi:MAG: four helix bundle protein [Candidatus Moranbacteria bacterium]|nr:four helix bundle protein [Candidatus Moranbacteria bacterium]